MSREARLKRLGLWHLRDNEEALQKELQKGHEEFQREHQKALAREREAKLAKQAADASKPPQRDLDAEWSEAIDIEEGDVAGDYSVGRLSLWCLSCDWKETGLKTALERCPKCGEQLPEDKALVFGGMTIRYRSTKDRFVLSDDLGREVTLYGADVPETVRFIRQHLKWTKEF